MGSVIQSPNEFLAALPLAEFELLLPYLRTVELKLGDVLAEAGSRLTQVYFPQSGIISKIISFAEGEKIDVAMIGREGVFGGTSLLSGAISSMGGVVRFPGQASIIYAAHFHMVMQRSPALRAALQQAHRAQAMQSEQIAACNASHGVEARLCWRLLLARDLARSDVLQLTQDGLAHMLGVQRNSVSAVAIGLQRAGILRYSRGLLTISDPAGLRVRACECHQMIKARSESLSVCEPV
ncbi:CRP-like cAMP-binding protein [Rhodopseudomonas rhenobacensis]|uniref:CRP-like cAMP-binding protein n=1 Tax=Rhodopseudomonas rhenobacensis TaxID=87461 RepID=A0A7W8E2D3_9BRAD|nr:Crp/Fnr family transcriptional regulator [Rhodopseudomonas rhenobacensis]MBB5049791.1 CRP-like cAMP-binding protein [Rhodopseudomonas rhenobacensis]